MSNDSWGHHIRKFRDTEIDVCDDVKSISGWKRQELLSNESYLSIYTLSLHLSFTWNSELK
jgi:hypothetical protein